MPIQTFCGECRAEFSVPDQLRGKSIRCKECGEPIRVGNQLKNSRREPDHEDDDHPISRRPRRHDDRDETVPRRPRKQSQALLYGLIAGGVGLVALVLVIVLVTSKREGTREGTGPVGFPLAGDEGRWPLPARRSNHRSYEVITLHVSGVTDDMVRKLIIERAKEMGELPGINSADDAWEGDRLTLEVWKVSDVEAFLNRVDFGQIQRRGDRRVSIQAKQFDSPGPGASEADRLIFELKYFPLKQRAEAAKKLALQPVNDARRRAVAVELERLLADPDVFHRDAAAIALGHWGTKESVGPLVSALADPFSLMKGHAITALGKLKFESAVEPLGRVLAQPGLETEQIIQALRQIGPASEKVFLDALSGAMSGPLSLYRDRIIAALGEVGTSRSLPALEAIARDRMGFHHQPAADAAAKIRARESSAAPKK
jgi:hypothetical protein